MKIISTFILTIIIITFNNCHDSHIKKTDVVNISEISIPDSSFLNDVIQIHAKAEAYNGCWKDLYISLNQVDDSNYLLNAFGTYESYGVCPAVMVYMDTLINFSPTKKGTIFFHANEKPFEILIDTLMVY